ncbi:hypothetical protein MNEG_5495 [Monoraphidium neglectum]|uniref:Flavin reductase like domain-containing protein n=1 Tax=Monoraphidium neglectum TaxID=145388 RepID=A0A0D2NA48_9CHLO|nr:hypothetical protein MNEG_5495 [Monoraphidium neglectum]KIZ02461.1 hypothetical protein MNEG_5495 [Monoraphidium neglectum]|eukprot:XP_013901480.1 hypothetical protein MNEG_5495 [Monoraphidium neglectum]
MALSGLTPVDSARVRAPRVGEAAIAFECKLRAVHDVEDSSGKPSGAIVIGEVLLIHVAEAVTGRSPTGKLVVDPLLLQPVSRLGGVTYGSVKELYDIPRPDKEGRYGPPARKG